MKKEQGEHAKENVTCTRCGTTFVDCLGGSQGKSSSQGWGCATSLRKVKKTDGHDVACYEAAYGSRFDLSMWESTPKEIEDDLFNWTTPPKGWTVSTSLSFCDDCVQEAVLCGALKYVGQTTLW